MKDKVIMLNGSIMKRLLSERGMTQAALAKEASCTEASISRYIAGERMPNFRTVIRIAEAIGVEPGILYGDSTMRIPVDEWMESMVVLAAHSARVKKDQTMSEEWQRYLSGLLNVLSTDTLKTMRKDISRCKKPQWKNGELMRRITEEICRRNDALIPCVEDEMIEKRKIGGAT